MTWCSQSATPRTRAILSCGAIVALVFVGAAVAVTDTANGQRVYGTRGDQAYADRLWKALRTAGLIGSKRLSPRPTKGEKPHGIVQQIVAGQVRVGMGGRDQRVVVKANHRGAGATTTSVYEQPNTFLTGYAVMAKRPGYDARNQDWFWVVYNPDGQVRRFNGRAIAGRVDTGKTNSCIGCHRKEGGADLEVLTRK
ncbi:MAG: hypothetical protein AAGG99_08775 [Pseudomonadota bacterium]